MQNLECIHLPGERHVAAWASPFPYLEAGAVSFQTCHNVWGRSVRQIFSCDVGLCLCFWHLEVHPMLSQLEVFVFSPSSRAGDIQRTPCSLFFLLGVWFTPQLCLAILGWPWVKSFKCQIHPSPLSQGFSVVYSSKFLSSQTKDAKAKWAKKWLEGARKWQLSIIFNYWHYTAASSSLPPLPGGCWLGLRVSSGARASPSAEWGCSQCGIYPLSCWLPGELHTCLSRPNQLLVCPCGQLQAKGPQPFLWWMLLAWAGMVLGWRGFSWSCLSWHVFCEYVMQRIGGAEKAPTPAENMRSMETGPFFLPPPPSKPRLILFLL